MTLVSAEPAAASVDGEVSRWSLGTLEPGVKRTTKVTVTPRNTGALLSRCEVLYRRSLHGTTEVYEPKLALGGKLVFEPLESLAVGASAEWTIVVRAVAAGDARFKVLLSSAEMSRPVEAAESTRFYGAK